MALFERFSSTATFCSRPPPDARRPMPKQGATFTTSRTVDHGPVATVGGTRLIINPTCFFFVVFLSSFPFLFFFYLEGEDKICGCSPSKLLEEMPDGFFFAVFRKRRLSTLRNRRQLSGDRSQVEESDFRRALGSRQGRPRTARSSSGWKRKQHRC